MVEPPLLERERDWAPHGSGTVRRGRGPPKTELLIENDEIPTQEPHSASVKIESLDPALLLSNSTPPGFETLSLLRVLPPSSQPEFHSGACVFDSGCGNLDLPPSPPPLPLVSESTVPHTHDDVLSMEMGPPGNHVTDEPPLKKSRITVPMSRSRRKLVSQETTSGAFVSFSFVYVSGLLISSV